MTYAEHPAVGRLRPGGGIPARHVLASAAVGLLVALFGALLLSVALGGAAQPSVDQQGSALAQQTATLAQCCRGSGAGSSGTPVLFADPRALERGMQAALAAMPGRRAVVVDATGGLRYASPMPPDVLRTLVARLRHDLSANSLALGTPHWGRQGAEVVADLGARYNSQTRLFGVAVRHSTEAGLLLAQDAPPAGPAGQGLALPVALAMGALVALALLRGAGPMADLTRTWTQPRRGVRPFVPATETASILPIAGVSRLGGVDERTRPAMHGSAGIASEHTAARESIAVAEPPGPPGPPPWEHDEHGHGGELSRPDDDPVFSTDARSGGVNGAVRPRPSDDDGATEAEAPRANAVAPSTAGHPIEETVQRVVDSADSGDGPATPDAAVVDGATVTRLAGRRPRRAPTRRETAGRATARQRRIVHDLLAEIAHELAVPLGLIQGYAEALANGLISGEAGRQAAVRALNAEATRLGHLGGDLLDLAALAAGEKPVRPEPVTTAALLDRLRERFAPLAARAGVTLTVEVESVSDVRDLPSLATDETLLAGVLIAVLNNALRQAPPGGTVSLCADSVEGRFVVVSGGRAAPRDDLPRLAGRLTPDTTTKRREAGSGAWLGLALCRDALALLGGRLAVETADDGGTTATIVLPPRAPHGGAVGNVTETR